jgi:PKD repeat protein
VADIGGPYSGTVNIALDFDASNSSDTDGSIASYDWDFGDGGSGSGAKVSHTYTDTGTFSVTLTVTDDAGDASSASIDVTIGAGNQSPVADAMGHYTGVEGEEITFDGSASSDADGSIDSYTWDFGDGANGSGANPTHTYDSAGTYNITLTVIDNEGAMDSDNTTASVTEAQAKNVAPVADPAGPYSGNEGEELVFDASGSSDSDGAIKSYDWDFGDGNTGSGASPAHTYTVAGTYNVTLTVTDDGGLTASSMTTATIGATSNEAPVANANGPYSGTTNIEVNFYSDGSEDPDGSIVAYSWDFGDGNTMDGASVSHIYTEAGTYTVTLTVEDDNGIKGADSATATIGVGNLSPIAEANGPYESGEGVEVQFDSSGSSDPDGYIYSYEWQFGDGATSNEANPVHSYDTAGTYNDLDRL